MGRRSIPSATPTSLVRKYFGLTQEELSTYLGLTRGQIAHVEAGRHLFSTAIKQPLQLLLQATLAPPAEAPTDPADPLAPPDAAPLQARLAYCQHHARKLRREINSLTDKLETARRWQAALPALLASAADERARAWLLRRQEQAAADLDAEAAARYHLLRLRLAALDGEAAGLAKLLGQD